MAAEPQFAATPRIGAVSIATADSSYNSPTNVGTVITGGTNGTRVEEIVVKSAATSAAAVVRIFLYDGSTYWLYDEIVVAAITGSATLPNNRVRVTYENLVLPSSSWSVRATTSVSQATHVIAQGADL